MIAIKPRHLAVLLGLLLMAAQGCKKSEPEQNAEPAEQAEAKPAAPEPREPEPTPKEQAQAPGEPKTQVTDGIPTEEDYEEEAAGVITAENLETQLDQLEAELKAN